MSAVEKREHWSWRERIEEGEERRERERERDPHRGSHEASTSPKPLTRK